MSFERGLVFEYDNEKKAKSLLEMIKLSKFTYTDEQIKLLDNSQIIAVYALPEKLCNNKEYVEAWNRIHPADIKEVEYKKINQIIIGYARDIHTNNCFFWVTDLGQDISFLFDYAE